MVKKLSSKSTIESVGITKNPSSTTSTIIPALDIKVQHAAVKVNNTSISELKNATDDACKLYAGRKGAFVQSHKAEDTRLILGYTSSIIAMGSAYYGYTHDFQESKLLVTVGVVIYWILAALAAYHLYYVERSIIFQGKRRTVPSRISTETLTISSRANFSPPSSFDLLTPLLTLILPTSPLPPAQGPFPSYSLHVEYVHSSNGGKSLIRKGEATGEKCFGELFDGQGMLWRDGVEGMVEELVNRASAPSSSAALVQ